MNYNVSSLRQLISFGLGCSVMFAALFMILAVPCLLVIAAAALMGVL